MMLSLLLAVTWACCVRPALAETKCSEPRSMYIHHLVQGENDYTDEFEIGTELTYECGPGYFPRNIKTWTATCVRLSNGSAGWKIEENDCRPVSCGHPGEVRWGRLLDAVFAFPRPVRYECNQGYRLVGDSTLYCQSNGRWSGTKPECHIMDCGALEDIPNGRVTLSGTTFGSLAEYACSRCFRLVGNSTRTCDEYGKWTGTSPRCDEVFCEPPQLPLDGYISAGPTDGKQRCDSKITYACRAGTTLVGSNSNSCFETGTWLFDPPACVPDCTVPETTKSVVIRKPSSRWSLRREEHLAHGATVTEAETNLVVRCHPGFHLIDEGLRRYRASEASLRCHGGQWVPGYPWCTEKSCRISPSSVKGGRPVLTEVPHGHSVEFTCNAKHTLLQDSSPPTCQKGNVVGSLPICKPDDCRFNELPFVEHGKPREGQSVSSGSFAQYYCESAFTLMDRGRLQCHLGSWIGFPPTCVQADCTVPETTKSAVMRKTSSWLSGTRELVSSLWLTEGIMCSSSGKERLAHGATVTEAETNLVVRCHPGFHLIDEGLRRYHASEASLRCHGGQWFPGYPWCTEKSCRISPSSVKGGQPVLSEVPHGQSVEFTCNSKHTLLQDRSPPTCQKGNVVGSLPICKPVAPSHQQETTCTFPGRQERFKAYQGHKRIISGTRVPHGANLNFHCEPIGATIFRGNRQSTCINGNWTRELPFCYDPDKNSTFVLFKSKNHTGPGGIVYVEPDVKIEVECWSSRPVELLHIASASNGTRFIPSRSNAAQATFMLAHGVRTQVICRHAKQEGRHSRSIAVKALYFYDCPMPDPRTSALIVTRRTQETYLFDCPPPYERQGRNLLHCLAYGEWDNDLPTCVLPSSQATVPESASPWRENASPPTPNTQAFHGNCTVTDVAGGQFVRKQGNGTPKKITTGKQLSNGTVIYLLCNTATSYIDTKCVEGNWRPLPACNNGTQPLNHEHSFSHNRQQQSHRFSPGQGSFVESADGEAKHATRPKDDAAGGNVSPTLKPEGERGVGTTQVSPRGDRYSSSRCTPPDTCRSTQQKQEEAPVPTNANAQGSDVANSFQGSRTSHRVGEDSSPEPTPLELQSVPRKATPFNPGEPNIPTAPPTGGNIAPDLTDRTDTASSVPSPGEEQKHIKAADTSTSFTDGGRTSPVARLHLEAPIQSGAPALSTPTTAQPGEPVNAVAQSTFTEPAEATATELPIDSAPRSGCLFRDFYKVAREGLAVNTDNHTEPVPPNTTFSAFCYEQVKLITVVRPVTCLQNGSWHVPAQMKCIKGCGNFETEPDGLVVEGRKDSYKFGDSITLSCKNGTELKPRIERMLCLGDEQGWSETRLPTCIPKQIQSAATKTARKTPQ
ncbi:sushi, von Willebrand factor type A, EGF and pentraxin domain-containing protein 1-like isoform X2 [Haemaphysalis longicornis]